MLTLILTRVDDAHASRAGWAEAMKIATGVGNLLYRMGMTVWPQICGMEREGKVSKLGVS